MKLLYAPFSLAAGLIGARLGRRAFRSLWGTVSDSPKLSATAGEQQLLRVAAVAAVEGATLGAVAAVANQLAARAFHHLFGAWPDRQRATQSS